MPARHVEVIAIYKADRHDGRTYATKITTDSEAWYDATLGERIEKVVRLSPRTFGPTDVVALIEVEGGKWESGPTARLVKAPVTFEYGGPIG